MEIKIKTVRDNHKFNVEDKAEFYTIMDWKKHLWDVSKGMFGLMKRAGYFAWLGSNLILYLCTFRNGFVDELVVLNTVQILREK